MQYCTECNAMEQGTITKHEEGYTDNELIVIGLKEAKRLGVSDLTTDEALEWGKDQTSYEICACCESEDDTMTNFDEDAGKD
jgi:hypothetical protein